MVIMALSLSYILKNVCMIWSVLKSTLAVASSNNTTLALRSTALIMATSWRWPVLRFIPFNAIFMFSKSVTLFIFL